MAHTVGIRRSVAAFAFAMEQEFDDSYLAREIDGEHGAANDSFYSLEVECQMLDDLINRKYAHVTYDSFKARTELKVPDQKLIMARCVWIACYAMLIASQCGSLADARLALAEAQGKSNEAA